MNEFSKIVGAFLPSAIFVSILWIIKIMETLLHTEFFKWGVYPLTIQGLRGIIFSPFLHGSYEHLLSNTFPLLILGWALFYFYRELGIKITLMAWLMSGIWVWVFARESYHIGASGIIYSWAAFLFVSGVIRNHPRLMALSLLVAFLYGSMVWGIFPLRERVSWEGHLMGMIAGVVLALFYREQGPKRKLYSWDFEEEEDETHLSEENDPAPYWQATHTTEERSQTDKSDSAKRKLSKSSIIPNVQISYIYTPKNQHGKENSTNEVDKDESAS